ncbi:WAP four-disulfide core domain protein 3-like isoform X2 [Haliotis rufescens]|uniref:WAP four-disulfide core domain protein 3-like isoform X2 n=1 Tax=Haliotis rufescens TaxID=6454 RepID=UPI001EAFBD57|nr:WAP four-disulfide core domain protein 3-like isoform X2 [Haliotis rufescens]
MVTAIVVLGLCAVVQGVPFKRQLIGACVEECSVVGVGFFSGCPHGQTCQSNGCGHTCQSVILGKRQSFGACVEMCSPAGSGRLDSCPAGYACMTNGCGHTCQSVMLKGRSIVGPTVVQGVPFKRQFECPDGHWCHPYIQGKRQSFGACVEMCSPAGSGRLDSCPAGYACMSNGCGHTCQSVMLKGRSMVVPKCPPVLCEMYCSNGFATGADGCPMCSCNSHAFPVDLQKLFGTLG